VIIPKTIKVGKTQYKIEKQKQSSWLRGLIKYKQGIIKIVNKSTHRNKPFSAKEQEETFWHEVTHAVLYDMNHSLYNNEKFVTEFSTRLNNAIRSAKF